MNKEIKIMKEVENVYNKIASHFSQTRLYVWTEMTDAAKLIKNNSSLLDIGCGNGRFLEALKDKNINYEGIDISENMISAAKKRFPQEKFEKLDYLSIKDKNKFDYIVSFAAFHHLPTPSTRTEALNNIHAALKDNGVFIGTVWNMWSFKKIKYIFKSFLEFLKGNAISMYNCMVPWKNQTGKIVANRFYYAFSKRELRKLLKKSNFKDVKIYYTPEGKSLFKASNIFFVARK